MIQYIYPSSASYSSQFRRSRASTNLFICPCCIRNVTCTRCMPRQRSPFQTKHPSKANICERLIETRLDLRPQRSSRTMALPHANTPLFNPACPCCQDDLGMHTIIPAAPGTRNPLSDPKESVRKELTQCQHCWKRKTSDVTLFKCTGCKVEVYCVRVYQTLLFAMG